MVYLKTFKLSDTRISNTNIYPFNILKNKEPDVFIFENITVLYGNNGSGKSTILNLIAHKLDLQGKERSSPEVEGMAGYFQEFSEKCEYSLGENETGKIIKKLPENSRYIKSEEILYEIRKVQQDAILKEGMICNQIRKGMEAEKAKNWIDSDDGEVQLKRFQFARRKIF